MTDRAVQTTPNEVPAVDGSTPRKQVSSRPTSSTDITAGQPTENRAVRRLAEPSTDGTTSSRPNRPGGVNPGRDGSTSEADFQNAVIDLAHTFEWRCAHFRAARTTHGWRTAVSADGAGWPDLTLVHVEHHQILFRELKSSTGKLTLEQQNWATWLRQAGADYEVWRPSLWPHIVETLSFGRATT